MHDRGSPRAPRSGARAAPDAASSLSGLAPKRGRPRKFRGPSRAVTITLPDNVVAALASVDSDLGRAIVRLSQSAVARRPHPPAELVSFGRRGIIVVNPTRTLEQHTGTLLIPLPDGRALISFDESMTVDRLELTIEDALDGGQLRPEDARIFETIRGLLKEARRSGRARLHERRIIVLESDRSKR